MAGTARDSSKRPKGPVKGKPKSLAKRGKYGTSVPYSGIEVDWGAPDDKCWLKLVPNVPKSEQDGRKGLPFSFSPTEPQALQLVADICSTLAKKKMRHDG